MNRIQKLKNRLLSSALFKDSFWALSGNIMGKGLAMLASIFVARFLGVELFGMYGLIRTLLLSVAVFSTFGLGYTATKFIAEYSKTAPERIRSIISNIMQITLFTGALFATFLFIFSKPIATYLDAAHLYESIRYLAIIVIFNSITTTQIAILAGFKRFKTTAKINLINGIITFVLSVILTYFFSFSGALIALLISQIINCLQNYIAVKRCIDTEYKQNDPVSIKKILVSFSLPIALQEMLYSILQWTMPILLVKLSNYNQVGLYNAAAQWSSVILFIPGALRNVVFSHFSSTVNNQNQQDLLLRRMLLINFLATFIPFCIIWAFSGLIVSAYGESFNGLQTILNFSVFTTIFTCMSSVYLQYFISLNKTWFTFWVRLLSIFMTIGLFILVMNYYHNSNLAALRLAQVDIFRSVIFMLFYHVYYYISKQKKAI